MDNAVFDEFVKRAVEDAYNTGRNSGYQSGYMRGRADEIVGRAYDDRVLAIGNEKERVT